MEYTDDKPTSPTELYHRYNVWNRALMAALTGLAAVPENAGVAPAEIVDDAIQYADEVVERDKAWRKTWGLE